MNGLHSLVVSSIMVTLVGGIGLKAECCNCPPVDEFLLYSPNGTSIQVVPLAAGQTPDMSAGELVAASAWCASDLLQTPSLQVLHNRDFIAVWRGTTRDCYSRFSRDAITGEYRETPMGDWPQGARLLGPMPGSMTSEELLSYGGTSGAAAADLDLDGIDDLILLRMVQQDDRRSWEYVVAHGSSDGSFEFGIWVEFIADQWVADLSQGDISGDGCVDLLVYGFPNGGGNPSSIYALSGRCDGTFDPISSKRLVLTNAQGAGVVVPGDFDGDGDLDLFLPPDDDVSDAGQCYIAFNGGDGIYSTPMQSVDSLPENESSTTDQYRSLASAYDLDLDGNLDVVIDQGTIGEGLKTFSVYYGDGTGQFEDPGETLLAGIYSTHTPVLALIPAQ